MSIVEIKFYICPQQIICHWMNEVHLVIKGHNQFLLLYDAWNTAGHHNPDCLLLVGRHQVSNSWIQELRINQ